MSCGCGKPKCDGKCGIGPSVLKIENNNCTLFHRVDVPASMGDETVNPPKNGAYKNVLLYYEASGNSYLYSSDGIPTKLTGAISDYEMLMNKPSINGVVLIKNKTLEDLGIIKAIDDAVGPEREERIAADEAEKAAREEADEEERDMRIQGDMALDQRISDEVSARAEADADLDAKITKEIADRTDGDTALDGKISDEIQARSEADSALDAKISKEIEDRTAADSDLSNRISGVASDLASEAQTRAEADSDLDDKIDGVAGDLATETAARIAADTALENKKADKDEIPTTVAELTDSANYVKFTDYATDSKAGVIKVARGVYLDNGELRVSSVSYNDYLSKTNQYFIGKGTLENVLTGKELQNATQVAEAVAAEAALREAGDTALDTRLTAETTARENADTALNNAITSETNAREIADEDLQEQIDAIAASSDVIDIVGTKAALDAYDKSKVHDNDIIKVLNDETRDHATTYYRFNFATQTWGYVGAEGPFYTKAEADGTFVPLTRTVNGKALSNNITLNAGDVGAATISALAAEAATRLADDEALQSQIDEATGAIEELDASKADKSEIPTTVAQLTDSGNYVKKTDYATVNTPGIIAAGNWITVNPTSHKLEAGELTKSQYDSANGVTFIGKTTLENVLTGKGFVDSTKVAELIAGKADKSELKDPADYYWANIKVSDTSSTDAQPSFGNITLTHRGAYPHIGGDGQFLAMSADGQWGSGHGSIALNTNSFYPSTNETGLISLGKTGSLWKDLYLSGDMYHGTYKLTLPNKAGTVALTSDIGGIVKANAGTLGTTTVNGTSASYLEVNRLTTATDLDTLKTTGLYIITASGCTNTPVSSWGTIYVDWTIGTKYQIYIADGSSNKIYKRGWNSTNNAWEDWTPLFPNNGTLTIQKNGTNVATFGANSASNATANITVPTKTSDLSNDSGFLTSVPKASADTLGGIKVGENLSIDSNGVLSAQAGLDNAYWANVKVSDTSSTQTTPEFKTIKLNRNDGGYPHIAGAGGILTLGTANSWNDTDGNLVLSQNELRSSSNISGKLNLGKTDALWKNLYMNGNIYKGSYTLTLPNKTGTVALTSDIPSIDTALSDTSTNPVQNKAVKSALDGKNKTIYTAANLTPTADTTAAWRTLLGGDGVYVTWYSQASRFAYQPMTYGFLVTYLAGNDIRQDFYGQNAGKHYVRSGNSTGWAVLDGESAGEFRDLGTKVDKTLSDTSTNPVQNKAVTTKINEIDRFYRGLVPLGTAIAANKDLNTIEFIKVGKYYCSNNATVKTLSNRANDEAFMMEVFSPLSTTVDNEETVPYVYRVRIITTYKGNRYIQYVESGSTAGVFTYGSWKRFATTSDIGNGTLTIQKNGTNVDTFTANATGNKTVNITVPTKTSDLTNDSSFATVAQATYTAGDHISIENNTITAEDYVHSENPLASISPTNTLAGSNITNNSIAFDKTVPGDFLKLQLTTVDPGEGSPLAANTILGVYQ